MLPDARAPLRASLAAVSALAGVTFRQLWSRTAVWAWPLGFCLYFGFMLYILVFLDKTGAATRETTYIKLRGSFAVALQMMIFLSGLFTGAGFVQDDAKNKWLHPLTAKPLAFGEFVAAKLAGGFLFLFVLAASAAAMFAAFDAAVLRRVAWEAWPGCAAVLLGGACALAAGALAEQAMRRWGGFVALAMLAFAGSYDALGKIFGLARFDLLAPCAKPVLEAAREVCDWMLPPLGAFAGVLPKCYAGKTPWDSLAWLVLYAAAYVALFGWMAAWLFGRRGRFRT